MNRPSPEAQAVLLLTAPLIIGRSSPAVSLLKPSEFLALRRHVEDEHAGLKDLLTPTGSELRETTVRLFGQQRISTLLARSFQLAQALERWSSRAIWVIGQTDPAFPSRLKTKLRDEAPLLLYGCGEASILEDGGLAIVGSRDASDEALVETRRVAGLAAENGLTVISGGARGIDQTAMRAAAQAGGRVTGVLADSLEKAVLSRENRSHLMDHRLVLVSPYDPSAGFNVGNAMNRNKVVYGLADAAFVASCTLEQGGTWAGATEQLQKYHFAPVFVRATQKPDRGLEALKRQGALRWPNIIEPGALKETLIRESDRAASETSQPGLDLASRAQGDSAKTPSIQHEEQPDSQRPWSELLLDSVRDILRRADSPMTEQQIAIELDVSATQARVWLRKLVDEGTLEKLARPVRYRHSSAGSSQRSLFEQQG